MLGFYILVLLHFCFIPKTYCKDDGGQSKKMDNCVRVNSTSCILEGTINVAKEFFDLACRASEEHYCKSYLKSYTNVSGHISLTYSVYLQLNNYDPRTIKMEVFQVSKAPWYYIPIETKYFKFPYLEEENPHIDCKRTQPISTYRHFYECKVGFVMISHELTSSTSDNCTIDIIGEKNYEMKSLIYTRNYTISVNHINQGCYEKCYFILVIQADFSHETSMARLSVDDVECKPVLISCPSHDQKTQTISCLFRSNSSFSLTKLEISGSNVTLKVNKIDFTNANFTEGVKRDISYNVPDSNVQMITFYIKFGIKMKDGKEYEIVSEPLQIKPKDNSEFYCIEEEVQEEESYLSTTYKCTIKSINKDLKMQISSPDYQLQCNPGEGVKTEYGYLRNDVILKIIANIPNCNVSTPLNISFEDEYRVVSWNLKYLAKCPDPVVKIILVDCDAQTLLWTIICPLKIYSMAVESVDERIKFKFNEHVLSKKDNNWVFTNTLKYVVTVNKTKDLSFKILIYIKLFKNSEQITKTLTPTCGQSVKKDLSYIKCSKKTEDMENIFEQKLVCQIFSIQKHIYLFSDNNETTLTMGPDSKKFQNGGYLRENQELTVTDNRHKCDWKENLKIYFIDGTSIFSTIFAHESTCISPRIVCDAHDSKQRTIKCKISANFKFTSVTVSDISKNVNVTVKDKEIKQHEKVWISEPTVSYDVRDLKGMETSFNLRINVFYNIYLVKNQTFMYKYDLREDEKLQLKCKEIDDEGKKQVSERKYSCSAIASNSDMKLKVEPNLFTIGWMKGEKGNMKNIFKWTSMEVSIQTTTNEECVPQDSLRLFFQDGDRKIETQLKFPIQCAEFTESCTFADLTKIVECSVNSTSEFKLVQHSCSDDVKCEIKSNDADKNFKTNQKYQFDISKASSKNPDGFKIDLRLSYTNGLNKKLSIPVSTKTQTAKVITSVGAVFGFIFGILIAIVLIAVIIVKANCIQQYQYRRGRQREDDELHYLITETDNFDVY